MSTASKQICGKNTIGTTVVWKKRNEEIVCFVKLQTDKHDKTNGRNIIRLFFGYKLFVV